MFADCYPKFSRASSRPTKSSAACVKWPRGSHLRGRPSRPEEQWRSNQTAPALADNGEVIRSMKEKLTRMQSEALTS